MNRENQMLYDVVPESDDARMEEALQPRPEPKIFTAKATLLCFKCRTTIEGRRYHTKKPLCFECKRERNSRGVWALRLKQERTAT